MSNFESPVSMPKFESPVNRQLAIRRALLASSRGMNVYIHTYMSFEYSQMRIQYLHDPLCSHPFRPPRARFASPCHLLPFYWALWPSKNVHPDKGVGGPEVLATANEKSPTMTKV